MLAAGSQFNWSALLSTLFVGLTTTTVLWRFIQHNAEKVEKARKKYARKLAAKQDKHTRKIVNEVLAGHMGAEEKSIMSIDGRLKTMETMVADLVRATRLPG